MQEAELEAKRVEAERLTVEKRRNEMMQEVAPAPRVRPMAWIGPLAEAVEPAALPLAPPRYPRKKPKVAPAPESVSDGLSSSAADRVGQPSSALGLLLSPFVVSQTLIGSAVGFGIATPSNVADFAPRVCSPLEGAAESHQLAPSRGNRGSHTPTHSFGRRRG